MESLNITWNILFGSFKREEEEPTYGLTKNIDTYHVAKTQLAGLAWLKARMNSADKLVDKIKYLYKPPGWSHEGKHETSEVLKKRAQSAESVVNHGDF